MTPDQSMPQDAPPGAAQTGSNPLAIVALIVGIVALLGSVVPILGIALAVVGLVLSIIGMKNAGSRGGAGKGAAIGGLVVSLIALPIGAVSTACGAACFGAAQSAKGMNAELDQRAQDEGYADFAAWSEAEPEAASAAAAEITKNKFESWGFKMDEGSDSEDSAGEGGAE